MTGAAERRNALHNPNTVGAGPRLRWQPFLPIYFSSLSTQSLALSVALNISGKMKNGLHFYLWLEISKYLHPIWMKCKNCEFFFAFIIYLFRGSAQSTEELGMLCLTFFQVQTFILRRLQWNHSSVFRIKYVLGGLQESLVSIFS